MKEEFFGDVAISVYNEYIIKVRHLENWEGDDDLDNAKKVTDGIKFFSEIEPRKGLLIISPSLYKKKEILVHFQQTDLHEVVRALLVNSFAAKIVANMYLKLAKGRKNETGRHVPFKLFTDQEKAITWLEQEVQAYRNNTSAPQ